MTPSLFLIFALLCSAPVRGDLLDANVVANLLNGLINAVVDAEVLGSDGTLLGLDVGLGVGGGSGGETSDEGEGEESEDEGGDEGGDEGEGEEGGGGGDLLDVALDLTLGELLDLALDLDLGGGGGEEGGDEGGEEEECGGDDSGGGECLDVETIDRSLNDLYCDQPYFVNFVTRTDENCLIDNVCYTLFPLPDDPFTFNIYRSTVFCDGSSRVETAIGTDISIGIARIADPFCTYTCHNIGYAGCDTYITYRCMDFGECAGSNAASIVGLSSSCLPLGLSCLQKVQEIVDYVGIPEQEYFILPMKLANRCVTEQICVNNIQGNFYRALNIPPPVAPPLLV